MSDTANAVTGEQNLDHNRGADKPPVSEVSAPSPPVRPAEAPPASALATAMPTGWAVSPAERPFGIGRCLAGFVDPALLSQQVPNFPLLPTATRQQIEARLGRGASGAPVTYAGRPTFGRVEDDAVLALLTQVAQELAASAPASPINLSAFEWVEIAPLVAGHLVTEAWPNPEQALRDDDDLSVARFCVLSYANEPHIALAGPAQIGLTTQPAHAVVAQDLSIEQGVVTVRYLLRPRIAPIRVWVVHGVAIAVAGLGRLGWLLKHGATRALCAVTYGYGTEVFGRLPTVPEAVVRCSRPPLIRDLLDDALSVSVPVRERETTTLFGIRTVGPDV